MPLRLILPSVVPMQTYLLLKRNMADRLAQPVLSLLSIVTESQCDYFAADARAAY
jgi:hypothetical protein